MPKLVRPLSEMEIKKAKPKEKQYKLFDGDGLFLLVFPNGLKRWRLNYSFNKKTNTLAVGNYPDMSLKEARDKRVEIRRGIKEGINPSTKLATSKKTIENTFKTIALEYFEKREDLSEGYIKDSTQKLEKDIFPYFGNVSMDSIEPLTMLNALQRIDKRGSNVSAKKTFSIVDRIYRYAVTVGKAKRNIMNDLDKSIAFRTVEKKNFAHTTDVNELKFILLAIDEYEGDYNTKMALKILPHVFVRPANIRYMEWTEVDFAKKLWVIPGAKMKTKRDHVVPLTAAVLKVLEEMKDVSYGVSKYIFPSRISNLKVLSENTLNYGMKRMGFNVTAHGFRHTFSTIAHENITKHKIQSDVIEVQLAHTVGNNTQRAYNKAQYIEERVALMEWWSKFLEDLKHS